MLAALAGACRAAPDPLTSELDRWSALLQHRTAADPAWGPIGQAAQPGLAGVREALGDGRRLLALDRLAAVRLKLEAASYVRERPAVQLHDGPAFTAEWVRMGTVLRDDLGKPSAAALASVHPAAVRAMAEAALPQVRGYYEASLDYGRSTTLQDGLSYLGEAAALRDFVAFCGTLGDSFPRRREPPLRPLDGEIEALESETLAAYRPPAAIARHGEFIGVSSMLKEARELNAAGLLHGALLRYLQAALTARKLRASPPVFTRAALAGRLRALDAGLGAGAAAEVDHTIGRLFIETARANLARGTPGDLAIAAAIAGDVLPRYLAALGPARPASPLPPAAAVTVTLVRWPYT